MSVILVPSDVGGDSLGALGAMQVAFLSDL
jgi:hypothetical protein